jgi:uncharacterized protein (DUF58 family)
MTDAEAEVRRTGRWRGVVGVTLVALAAGLLANRSDLLLLGVPGIVFAVYPRLTGAPTPVLGVERRLSDEAPRRGDEVEVTVTLYNEGEETLFDLRLVDGVPPTIGVAEGSPRHGAVLRPGESTTYTYTVTAERGRHRFDPATVAARDLSGAHEVETTVATDTELDCTATAASLPLRSQTLQSVGQVTANAGGNGVEFHRTREYQPGDGMNRVDWNRYARTGEPTTIEYRRERAVEAVLVVDARRPAYRGRGEEPHAVAYSVSAARQVLERLLETRNRVGLAGFGREMTWAAPDAGSEHAEDLQRLLATRATFAPTPPVESTPHEDQVRRLRERLSEQTQVVLLTPLCDDEIVETARTLEAHGHGVTVISPTVTRSDSPGRRLAALERSNRISALRNAEIPVVEWETERPLAAAITATQGDVHV